MQEDVVMNDEQRQHLNLEELKPALPALSGELVGHLNKSCLCSVKCSEATQSC